MSVHKDKKEKTNKKLTQHMSLFFKTLAVIIVSVSLVFIAATNLADVKLSYFTDSVRSVFLNFKKGDGFPHIVSNEGVKDMDLVGSDLSFVDNNHLINLNSNAGEILKVEHNFIKPALIAQNQRVLLFDRESSQFLITSSSKVLYDLKQTEKVLSHNIITAAIGKKGNVAFGTWSDEGICQMSVFSYKLKKQFVYNFASDRITSLSLSDNGKHVAVSVLGAKDAQVYSIIYIFSLDSTKPIVNKKIEGETVTNIDFLDDKNVNIISTQNRYVLTSGNKIEEKKSVDFQTHTLSKVAFDNDSGRSAILLSEYGNTGSNILYGFSSSGKKQFEIKLKNIKKIDCNRKYVVALSDDTLYCYNANGKLRGEIILNVNIDDIKFSGNRLYLFSGSKIYSCKPNRFTELEKDKV